MAVAVSTTGTIAQTAGAATPHNNTGLTIPGGLTNSALIVFVAQNSATLVTGCTWGGTAMTSLGSITGTGKHIRIFGLLAPASGNLTLSVTYGGGSLDTSSCAMVMTGVEQSSIAAAFTNFVSTAETTSANASRVVTSATGNLAVAHFVNVGVPAFTAITNTQIFNGNATSINTVGGRAAGAASVTFTATNTSVAWIAAGVNVVASGGAAAPYAWGFDEPSPLRARDLRQIIQSRQRRRPEPYDDVGPPAAVDQTLTATLWPDPDGFFTHAISKTIGLGPSLHPDAEAFFTQTLLSTTALAPAIWVDTEAFFTQIVTPGARDLAPAAYTDTETYFTQAIAGGVVSASAFDPTRLEGHATLSNGNLTATLGSGATFINAYGTISHTAGKWIFRITVNNTAHAGNTGIGLATAASTSANGNYLGIDLESYCFYDTGSTYHNGANIGFGFNFNDGDTVDLAVDADGLTVRYSINGGSFSATVALPDFAGDAIFPAVCLGDTGDQLTYSGTTVGTLAGYVAWDATVGVTLTAPLFTDSDAFFTQLVTPGSVTLTPTLWVDPDAFFTQAITAGAVNLAAALYTDSETFFTHVVTPGARALTATLYADTETYFTQAVTAGAVALSPTLYPDPDAFFTQTIAASITLPPNLYVDTETYQTQVVTAGAVNLSPPLYSDVEAYFTQVIAAGAVTLSPALYTDPETYFTQTVTAGARALTPTIHTDTETYFTQVVTAGAVTLTPALYSDAEAFFTQSIATSNTLIPSLYTDSDSFFTQVVAADAVNLAPTIHPDTETFGPATITTGAFDLAPQHFADPEAFFTPVISTGSVNLTASLYTDIEGYFTQTISAGASALITTLYTDNETFFTQVIGGYINLTTSLHTDTETYFTQTITGLKNLTTTLHTDQDGFFTQSISASITISPMLYIDPETFFTPVIGAGASNLVAALYVDPETYFTQTIGVAAKDLSPTPHSDTETFFTQTISVAPNLLPSAYTDPDAFFTQTITTSAIPLLPILHLDSDTFFPPIIQRQTDQILVPQLYTDPDLFYPAILGTPAQALPDLIRSQQNILYYGGDRRDLGPPPRWAAFVLEVGSPLPSTELTDGQPPAPLILADEGTGPLPPRALPLGFGFFTVGAVLFDFSYELALDEVILSAELSRDVGSWYPAPVTQSPLSGGDNQAVWCVLEMGAKSYRCRALTSARRQLAAQVDLARPGEFPPGLLPGGVGTGRFYLVT